MKISKKIEAEIKTLMNDYWASYLEGNLAHWANYLVADYQNIGTTEEEIWKSKKEILDYSHRVIDQLKGVVELRDKTMDIISYEPYVMVHEFIDMYLMMEGEWIFYQKCRLSSLLQKIDNDWKVLHQHGSFPDSKIQEGEVIGKDVLKAENERLLKAVENRTAELVQKNRELEIEGALQRVRAQVASMERSEDLLNIVVDMRHEFVSLGHEAGYFWHMRWLPEKYQKAMTSGDGTQIGTVMELPRRIHGEIPVLADWEKSDEPTVIFPMDVDATLDYVHKMGIWGDFERIDPNMPTEEDVSEMGGITYVMARTSLGEIGYSLPGVVESIPQAELDILVRFARTFDLAHKRFEDLKKSEQQAREVQIELALEKVRSRTMAMQKSEELPEAANNLFLQVQELGIPAWSAGYCIWTDDKKGSTACMSSEGVIQKPFILPNVGVGYNFQTPLEKGETFHIEELGGALIGEHYEFMRTLPIFGEIIDGIIEAGHPLPSFQIFHICYFKHGYVMFITYESVPEAHEIFKRFAKVFEQTYTRFLDLKKAEAQAREAQIEAAMERIRGRALAMHSSEEIMDVIIELRRQIDSLGQLNLEASVVHLYVDGSPTFESIAAVRPPGESGNIVLANVVFPVDATDRIKDMIDMYYSDQNEYTIEFTKEMAEEWQRVMLTHAPMIAERRVGFVENRRLSSASEFWNFADFSEGSLLLVTHSPASDDTKEVLRKAANVFDLAYRRYRDLQKAEARAWEAQIEAALEKVRSRSLAMHKTDELGDVIMVVFEKLKELKISVDEGVALITFTEGSKDLSEWMFNPGFPSALKFELPYFDHPVLSNLWEAKNKGEDFLVKRYTPEENQSFLDHIFNYTDFKHTPEEVKTASLAAETYSTSIAFQENTAIFINDYSGISLSENEIDILKRFSRVFEQAYTRFLDLQKAEAQAREAQIEMALEKVRSRTMVMQQSDELPEAANLLFKEIQGLGIPAWSCGYNILSEDKTSAMCWMSSEDAIQEPFELTYQGEPSFEEMYSFFIGNDTFLCQKLGGKDLERHYAFMRSLPKIGELIKGLENSGISLPTFQINHLCKFQQGYLLFITYEPIPDAHHIFIKFTKVFEQTYTRFLDLQKAEAQAKEAQIEAALERVRSQTMGMQTSDDLSKVTTAMFEQLRSLGGELYATGIVLCDKHEGHVEQWHSVPDAGMLTPFSVPIDLDYIHQYRYDQWEKGTELFSIEIPEDFIAQHFDTMFKLPSVIEVLKDFASKKIPMPETPSWEIDYGASFKHGYLLVSALQPFNETDILPRFAKVFEQTYTRFLDLQKAEARAREAQIEADLEKVRSRSLAMGKPEELQEVVAVVAERLKELGVIYDAGGVILCTYFPDNKDVVHWIAVDDFSSSGRYLVPYFDNPIFSEAWDSKSRGDAYFSKKFSVAAKNSFFEYAFEHSDYRHMPEEYKQFVLEAEQHHLSAAWSKNSAILIPSLTGVVPSESDAEILKRFAKVFEQAYIRFMDLQVKEEQAVKLLEEKQRLEITLNDLQNTQTQLIQAEKMASLGELTAGIAHEIQNPLNFVNNFSDVSGELIDEAVDELNKNDVEEVKEILSDLKNNLEKISHHGGRASGIVKGMLDHSRNSSGEKVPTDINALADEYLRLSYHGLRAKDKSFNCALETNFDPKLEKIKVIPQDIGRVLLNIYNNAFYACSARGARTGADRSVSTEGLGVGGANEDDASPANAQPTDASVSTELTPKENPTREEYKPLVTLTTKRLNDSATITISDNGIGMSKATLEKVFQPFFTTKPTGSGTGLGMSISYDIITKGHGGELKVESEEGKGTRFIIHLPFV